MKKNTLIELKRLGHLVQDEMIKIGLWNQSLFISNKPEGAFGGTDLKFEEWLQLVFLPNIFKALDENSLPKKSQLASAAIRNFDGFDKVNDLIDILGKIDELINKGR